MATLETRETVGLIAPRSRPRFPGPLEGATAHWNGPALGLAGKPHSACRAAWRGVQRFHMGRYYTPNPLASGRHWSDIAYTAAVCNHEIVLVGRGPDVRTAANGTAAGNDRWLAVFFMVGGHERPSGGMLRAAEWYARVHLKTTRWNRHTDHKPTSCAGTVNAFISGGRIAAIGGEERDYITVGDKGDDVRSWQKDLMVWRSGALPQFGADGDFGGETTLWTLRFMDAVDLTVSDRKAPRVGPATRAKMKEALVPPTPKPVPGPFSDVPGDSTHAASIQKVKDAGVMQGYDDGTFRPHQPLTRGQLASVVAKLLER